MRKSFGFIISILGRKFVPFVILALCTSLTAIVGPLSTVLTPKLIMDELMGRRDLTYILGLIIGIVVLNIIRNIAKMLFDEICLPKYENEFKCRINEKMITKVCDLDIENFDSSEFKKQYNRAITQCENIGKTFLNSVTVIFDRIVYVGTIVTIIATLDPVLILFSVISVISIFFFNKIISKENYNAEKANTQNKMKIKYIEKIFYNREYLEDIHLLPLKQIFLGSYREAYDDLNHTMFSRKKKACFYGLIDGGIRVFILEFCTLSYLTFCVFIGRVSVSSFMALFMATVQLCNELFIFVNGVNRFYKISVEIQDVLEILNMGSKIEGNKGDIKVVGEGSDITISNVSFQYPFSTKEVLTNINMKIRNGEKVAVVGENGSGKSTLLKLILHLYDPTKGEISINGVDLRNIDTKEYRERIGNVTQKYHYYAMSIKDNILLKTKAELPEKGLNEIIDMCDLRTKVDSLKGKENAILTKELDEDGAELSGGEAQKIAIAREIASENISLLILDEASAAMDPISENKINQMILQYAENKTLIMVSHHLSTVKDMNYIYVLDQGKIIEEGTHDSLIEKGGKYAQMWKVQSQKYH